ncbi:hypothetical protein AGLY_016594 [Aphis glycines]|uniref:Double jelly roll-like domain-containing protein n=1 Tax=Aphis glycines TaxID=307491 RepID=A0A6G0SX65_APHGL|nr:hypothetical protein AGLY_016594 [Aphis glycines]
MIKLLDSACRDHHIAYVRSNSFTDHNEADRILEQRAWDRFMSKDSSLKEKAVAWGVTTAMKAKRKIGDGCGYKAAIKAAKNVIKKNIGENNLLKLSKKCVAVARKTFKTKKTKALRIITVPKKGGVLPLIPIFTGLSALEALTGGVANIVKMANEFNIKTPLHLGNEVYLAPYKGNSYKIVTPNKTGGATLPNRALYDYELLKFARDIPHFIGVHEFDFSVENSVVKLLDFRNVLYTTGVTHESENTVKIMKVNCIKVECNLIVGSFCDGAPNQTKHELYPSVPAGYKIVENMDSYTLPCESFIYIEGNLQKPSDAVGDVRFSNNGLAFLFSEMRYEINEIEIQKLKSPGVSSCLKVYCSYTPNDLNTLDNCTWGSEMDGEDNKNFMTDNVFAGCIPLKHFFGFCEDYKKILLNCNQQLILNRSSTDLDVIRVVGAGATKHVEQNKKITIELTKMAWKMPIIKVTDKEKLKLLKVLDSRKTLSYAFRTWDLCEYPVHLNSEVFPYEDFRADLKKNTTYLLYKAYTDFQKSYYERDYCEPLLSKNIFQTYVPFVFADLSRQNKNVKSSTIDLRIEFETDTVIPEKTAAYCLILHDQIITYNPFSGDVRKFISISLRFTFLRVKFSVVLSNRDDGDDGCLLKCVGPSFST